MEKEITISNIENGMEEYALERVLELVRQGYTSGIDPTWDITNDN